MNIFFKKTKGVLLPIIIFSFFMQGFFGFAQQTNAGTGAIPAGTTAAGADKNAAATNAQVQQQQQAQEYTNSQPTSYTSGFTTNTSGFLSGGASVAPTASSPLGGTGNDGGTSIIPTASSPAGTNNATNVGFNTSIPTASTPTVNAPAVNAPPPQASLCNAAPVATSPAAAPYSGFGSSIINPLSTAYNAVSTAATSIMDIHGLLSNLPCLVVTVLGWLSEGIEYVSGIILFAVGQLYDTSLGWAMNISTLVKDYPVVTLAWQIFRDIANLCFMFILLYIAIMTILRATSFNTKQILVTTIITAILLNFSFLFASFVIDTSNIITVAIYNDIQPSGTPITFGVNSFTANGISGVLLQGLGMTTFWNSVNQSGVTPGIGAPASLQGPQAGTWQFVWIGFGSAALMGVVSFVLLASSFLFIIRLVVLILLLMSSSIAVAAYALPQTRKYFESWFSLLIGQSLFAPVYILIIYIVAKIIQTTQSSGGLSNGAQSITDLGKQPLNFAAILAGQSGGSSINSVFMFGFLIFLMITALIVAGKFGAVGSKVVISTGKNLSGQASFGLSSALLRRTVGAGADKLANSRVGKFVGTNLGAPGRLAYKGVKGVAGSSFDARNIKAVDKLGLGKAGGKGGYTQLEKDRAKAIKEDGEHIGQFTNKEKKRMASVSAIARERDKKITEMKESQEYKDDQKDKENRKNAMERANMAKTTAEVELKAYKDQTTLVEVEAKKLETEKNNLTIARNNFNSSAKTPADMAKLAQMDAEIAQKEADRKIKVDEVTNRKIETTRKEAAIAARGATIQRLDTDIKDINNKYIQAETKIRDDAKKQAGGNPETLISDLNKKSDARKEAYVRNFLFASPSQREAMANLLRSEKTGAAKLAADFQKMVDEQAKNQANQFAPTPGSVPPPISTAGGGGTGSSTP